VSKDPDSRTALVETFKDVWDSWQKDGGDERYTNINRDKITAYETEYTKHANLVYKTQPPNKKTKSIMMFI
jgi:hypothetical protein